jgi:GNAT superfamily N-acetyltransferase
VRVAPTTIIIITTTTATTTLASRPEEADRLVGTVAVRRRTQADMDQLVGVARAVQLGDGYPGRRPLDLATFLASPDALAAWVAEHDGVIVGHVALHRQSLPVVMEQGAAFLGREASELGVVARLLVEPTARRAGIGRALLATAAREARSRGLHPILDVVTSYRAANRLYRACGWRNAGEVTMVFADGTTLQSYVYVGPD